MPENLRFDGTVCSSCRESEAMDSFWMTGREGLKDERKANLLARLRLGGVEGVSHSGTWVWRVAIETCIVIVLGCKAHWRNRNCQRSVIRYVLEEVARGVRY